MRTLLQKCVCGNQFFATDRIHGIDVLKCSKCGVIRQHLDMNVDELEKWYESEYFKSKYQHTTAHDLAVARVRLDRYGFSRNARILDVGAGWGSFVAAARERGYDAWGQDVAAQSESEFIYKGELEDIAFPTDSFDVVTVHDVLEHLIDPIATLREIRRVLRRPGKLVLDFPRFFHKAGEHHWKPVEHLWMFSQMNLHDILAEAGFKVVSCEHPIPSKIVIEAEPLPEKRPQILVPSGIGDSWWVLTKLPGFLKAHGLGMPDVWVQDAGGPKRTAPFLHNIPMINAAGYLPLSDRSAIFREAYVMNKRTVFQDILPGIDYFIAYNGVMRAGRSLEEVDPEFGCEWRPKIHISKEALKMRDQLRGPGEYILTFWAEAGMYKSWLLQFSPTQIYQALKQIEYETKKRIIFMGAKWDIGQVGREIAHMNPDWTDLIGATSFDQMLGAILGASAVVGFPAGNTMLGTMFNIPTVLLWNEYFDDRFWKYSVAKDSPYIALDTRGLAPARVAQSVRELLDNPVFERLGAAKA